MIAIYNFQPLQPYFGTIKSQRCTIKVITKKNVKKTFAPTEHNCNVNILYPSTSDSQSSIRQCHELHSRSGWSSDL